MTKPKTQKNLHEKDWALIKGNLKELNKRKDIAQRMNFLLKVIKKTKHKKIMDIGCGSGYLMYLAKKEGIDFEYTVGIDISQNALNRAKKLFDKTYLLNLDKQNLPKKEKDFDLVICSEVLEHLYDITHCLKEIQKVLSPTGKAILTVPNFGYIKYRIQSFFGEVPSIIRDPRHLSAFNIKILKKECEKADLKILKQKVFEGGLSILKVKLFKYLFCNTLIVIVKKKN